jgi:hypothetical protein
MIFIYIEVCSVRENNAVELLFQPAAAASQVFVPIKVSNAQQFLG